LNWNPGDIVNITDRAGIDKVVNELHNVIQRAYSQSTTVKTVKCTAPWWNKDLTNQRNTLRKVKKRLRKEHDLNKKQEIRNEYTTLFKNYKTAINKARSQAWKDFCSKVGNKNLWSTPYYVVTGKKKKLQIPPSIRINNDEYASSITETYRHIIHELFPDDRLDQDDQYHKDIRANIEKDYHTINDTPFTMLEIDREFRRSILVDSDSNTHHQKNINRGCPQGSRSGLYLWNILYNSLLKLQLNLHSDPQALLHGYADDTVLLLSHVNHEVLQDKINQTLSIISDWCEKNKLLINHEKCHAIVFPKGNILKKGFSIKINNRKIKNSTAVKYLGIMMDQKLNWTEHMRYIYGKAVKVVQALKTICRNYWGYGPTTSRILYTTVIEPMVTYGSEMWGSSISRVHIRRKLLSIQRFLAINIAKSCKTAPTEALLVINHTLPIDLKIWEIYINYNMSKLANKQIDGVTFQDIVAKNPFSEDLCSLVNLIVTNGLDKCLNYHPCSSQLHSHRLPHA
ncbi:uncharacterized protein LOC111616058, partial [Centruroides sculpturatus]|uniref:uncharacterized protein LOC111616058 n=1 Tax=Centruroides sculpturatus TaxID=218467 RepID=UPI000C6E2A1D